jgi:hypothetical protein
MPDDPPPAQVWRLALGGHRHRVEVRGSVARRLRWYVDDDLVAEKKSTDAKVRIGADDRPELGVVGLRFSGPGRPLRATLFEPDAASDLDPAARALTGLGGVDLEPEPGSRAAEHEDRVRAHPRRYTALATAGGIAKVVVPILLATVLARLALSVPLPDWDLPRFGWPDLPAIPWPDLPAFPWPDLPAISWPEWSVPGWVEWLRDHAKYVWPVVLAYVLARREIARRRSQDELRAARAGRHGDDE